MCLRKGRNWLPGSHHQQWRCKNGPFKAKGSSRLAEAKNTYWNKAIPQVHWLLSILHSQILQNCTTSSRPYKEKHHMEMGRTSAMGIWRTKNTHVPRASVTTTGLWEEVLPLSWHILIWHGRRTLTGGKTPYTIASQTTKTHFTPHSILFSHVHTNQKELLYLWKGATSHDESPCTLKTVPRMDKGTIRNYDGSCKFTILEVT